MSDEGEKMCPLCAEEMDLTDQQLKPCKCGYEICVWCWHQIMEMAEKDATQGRCPACRTPYDKEKIVGMASKCERLVSGINGEKKLKSQKGKTKTSEGRKQLDSVRVIQRNLVYVVGLPFHLADEDVLQRKEYFGQYGKVLKVSISRTSTGAIQHFPNNTCSVYITYSKEEEAIRCIQIVHAFVLDGRPLRACFGTTKYCHAWLRNVPCSNPDCLYLHEIGSQEDSFTKDEIISAYTRNQVQHITGATYSTQRRSGTFLPSPVDDNSDTIATSQGKLSSKASTNPHNSTGVRDPSPDSSSSRSPTPTVASSWGSHSSATNTHLVGLPAQKPNVANDLTSLSKSFVSVAGKKVAHGERTPISHEPNMSEASQPNIVGSKTDGRVSAPSISVSPAPLSNLTSRIQSARPSKTVSTQNTSNAICSGIALSELREDVIDEGDGNINNICSGILSMNVHDQKSQNGYFEPFGKSAFLGTSENAVNIEEAYGSGFQSDFRPGLQPEESKDLPRGNHLLSVRSERVDGPATTADRMRDVCPTSSSLTHSTISTPDFSAFDSSIISKPDGQVFDRNLDSAVLFSQDFDDPSSLFSKGARSFPRRDDGETRSYVSDKRESSIVSSILASDFDPLNQPFALPQSLGELFGEEKQLYKIPIGSRKPNNSGRSRFAFAQEEGLSNQVSGFGSSGEATSEPYSFLNNSNSSIFQVDKFVSQINSSAAGGVESDIFTNNQSHFTSSRLPASKSQIAAPPGFAVPSRLPPPGFPSLNTTEHKFESASGSNTPGARFLQRNYPSGDSTYTNGDIEFIDPAILAVGKGTLAGNNNLGIDVASFSPQFGREDPRVQPIMHRSVPQFENHRFPDLRETISSFDNGYGNSSRVLEQNQSCNMSPFSYFASQNGVASNVTWDNWNEAQRSSNMSMPGMLRPERLVFNDPYFSNEDSKMRLSNSDGQYNGIYRI